jgi:hypothetical protein
MIRIREKSGDANFADDVRRTSPSSLSSEGGHFKFESVHGLTHGAAMMEKVSGADRLCDGPACFELWEEGLVLRIIHRVFRISSR